MYYYKFIRVLKVKYYVLCWYMGVDEGKKNEFYLRRD
jgi:hypothetical protein